MHKQFKESATRDGTHGEAIRDSYRITTPHFGRTFLSTSAMKLFGPY
jgi:hypothetical protein